MDYSTSTPKTVVTKWADGWVKKNWRRSDGGKVMNRDIIEPLMEKIKSRPGPIKWVSEYAIVSRSRSRTSFSLTTTLQTPWYP